MKRLVYTPSVDVFVKADSGIIDLSPYVTSCTVERRINQVSSATVQFRNPNFVFTKHKYRDPISKKQTMGPLFHPMDPIVISMTRLKDRPVQVFTGYCDSTPYMQLFPGTAQITASCTLKRLLYTYWDPGLAFVQEWLVSKGWSSNSTSGGAFAGAGQGVVSFDGRPKQFDGKNLNDSGIGGLLYSVLTEIAGWPDKNIYIEPLPGDIATLVEALFQREKSASEQAGEEFRNLLHDIVGTGTLGSGGGNATPTGSVGGSGPATEAVVDPVDVGRAMLTAGFPANRAVISTGIAIVNCESAFGRNMGPNPSSGADGYWQFIPSTAAGYGLSIPEGSRNLVIATAAAWKAYQDNQWYQWCNFEGGTTPTCPGCAHANEWVKEADQAIKLGPFSTSGAQHGAT